MEGEKSQVDGSYTLESWSEPWSKRNHDELSDPLTPLGPGELAPDYQSCLFISIWWFILVPLIMMRCIKIRNTIRTVHFQSNVSHYYYNLIVTVDFSYSNRNFNRWFRPHQSSNEHVLYFVKRAPDLFFQKFGVRTTTMRRSFYCKPWFFSELP